MNCYILHPYMNSHAVDFNEKFHQNHGLVSDYSSGFGCSSPVYMLHEPMISMSTYTQQEIIEEGLKQQIYIPEKSSGAIIHQFKSPASAFYAKERCMGIPQIGFRLENSSHVLGRLCNSQILPNQASAEIGSIDLDEADDPNFQMRNTLQSLVKSQICGDQPQRSSIEEPFELSSRNFHGSKFLSRDKFKRFFDLNTRNNEINSISFSPQSMKQPPNLSSGMTSSSSSSSSSFFIDSSRKSRIRWTQDLHEKFVECVKYLGGADKATPKAILKLMDSEGLTVLHVKSHLQKYRNAKYTPESAEERSKRRCISSVEPQFDAKTGMQIKESLQLQLDVQRRLHEQLEIQKKLQLQIEAQGRKLKMMFDEQQKTRQVLNTFPPDIPSNAIDDGAQAYTSESSEISQLQFNTSSSLNPENNFSLLNHC